MLTNPLAIDVSSKDILNPLPGLLVDECLVTSVIVDPLKLGLTLVVGIGQYLV